MRALDGVAFSSGHSLPETSRLFNVNSIYSLITYRERFLVAKNPDMIANLANTSNSQLKNTPDAYRC